MTDNGLAALTERLRDMTSPMRSLMGRQGQFNDAFWQREAAAILANGAVFLPDGLGPVMVGMAKEIAALRDALDGLVAWLASRDATNWSPGWSEDYRNGYDTAVEEVRTALAKAKETP